MRRRTQVPAIVLVQLRPELDELDLEQRWRARCETCGWVGAERFFRERASMDGRHHDCDQETRR